jgi:beta-aspartyl-peptidase (threonine type)
MHLVAALRAGWRVLSSGGSSVAAVEAAIMSMEDSPHFNAGFGAVLNEAGEHELDASIMDGSNLAAGAVCAVRRTRHPVAAARAVMEHSSCVLIAGAAADAFAERQGLEIVENSFFTTPKRVQSLATIKQRGALGTIAAATEAEKHGTVGAAALDSSGTLAAATSTGGFTNKPVRPPPTRAAATLCTTFTAQPYTCMRARAMSTALRGSESVSHQQQLHRNSRFSAP